MLLRFGSAFLLLSGLLAACGSSVDPVAATGPIERRELPLGTPSFGGYTLVDVYPEVVFDIPSAIAWAKDNDAPFVLERTGQIKRIEGGKTARTVLDFGSQVHVEGEGGALGLVLHPLFGDGTGPKPYVYVWYNALPLTQRLERYTWDAAQNAFDPGSALTMIEQQEFENVHNAGKLLFGPNDGFLYFGNGDDARTDNHQTITNGLFAGIFRIDVDMDPAKSHPPPDHTASLSPFTRTGYGIPNDNPFVDAVPNGLEEFYALGLRNPFGFSFDRQNANLWVGDVGESFREEVDQVVKGANFQWPLKEAELDDVETKLTSLTVGASTPPKYAYGHSEMADLASIFGGIVYRGASLPELNGKYLYSDWPSNRIWALDLDSTPPRRTTLVDNQYKMQPMGIGEGNDAELYVLEYDESGGGGHVKKLVRDVSAESVPKRLRETTLFDDVSAFKPAANLVPYEVSSPLWSDGALKKRWIRVPDGAKVTLREDGGFEFPVGTIFVKQFDVTARRVETRVMVVGTETTWGVTYRWNAEGTDANLVSDGADETIGDRSWHYPSFGQCWSCHRQGNARILGFTPAQIAIRDQPAFLADRGVLDRAALAKIPAALPAPSDTSKTLEERAAAYLAANCAPCHHEGASFLGGGQTWLASFGAGDLTARGLDQPAKNVPMAIRLGIPDGLLVARGDPSRSLLLARMKSNDPDLRMPPIARQTVDEAGVTLIEQWIRSMAP
jgi:glucose/arabinose dehydrogenase